MERTASAAASASCAAFSLVCAPVNESCLILLDQAHQSIQNGLASGICVGTQSLLGERMSTSATADTGPGAGVRTPLLQARPPPVVSSLCQNPCLTVVLARSGGGSSRGGRDGVSPGGGRGRSRVRVGRCKACASGTSGVVRLTGRGVALKFVRGAEETHFRQSRAKESLSK